MNKIHIIAGPTASGKSARAIEKARAENGVIINSDSQQLYQSLPILTAQPSADELKQAPHALYGFVGDDTIVSAADWAKLAAEEIEKTWNKGALPILCGGTGFYLKALMDGFSPIPDVDLDMRKKAQNEFEEMGESKFRKILAIDDPQTEARLQRNDKQRLVRAREVFLATGKSLSYWQSLPPQKILPQAEFEIQLILPARKILYERCNSRIYKMLDAGALNEVRQLFQKLNDRMPPVTKALGYAEFKAHIKGEISLEDSIEKTAQITRNYAKRQVTWFRNQILSKGNEKNIAVRE